MSPTQVSAAKILLDRTLPVLSAAELTGGVTNFVARLPEPAKDAETWAANNVSPVSAIEQKH
jgi:hypothetical protein